MDSWWRGIRWAALLSSFCWDRCFCRMHYLLRTYVVCGRRGYITVKVDHGGNGGLRASTWSQCCQRRLCLEAIEGSWCRGSGG